MGIYVMVDVIYNHADPWEPIEETYPFNKMEYYHPRCTVEDNRNDK